MPLFRRKGDRAAIDPDARSPETGIKYKDLAVVGHLLQAGADLTQPRHVLHYLYFPTSEAAGAAAEGATARGFRTEVREPLPAYPDQWSLVAELDDAVLDPPTIRDHGDLFDALAAQHGGEYDGWEAAV